MGKGKSNRASTRAPQIAAPGRSAPNRSVSSEVAARTHVATSAQDWIYNALGMERRPTLAEVRGMTGADDDAVITATTHYAPQSDPSKPRQIDGVKFKVDGPYYDMTRELTRQQAAMPYGPIPVPAGALVMHNVEFHVAKMPGVQDETGKGHGTRMFARQVKTLQRMGVPYISTLAGGWRGSQQNGYRTWPRLGYDGLVGIANGREIARQARGMPLLERARLARLGEEVTFHDLYRTSAGRAWWAQHGNAVGLVFDTRPGSRSEQVLRSYAASKGIRWSDL